VQVLGAVARDDLPAIYRGARAFVFPSDHEGFGLPVLEAAACGVPVVCTAIAALEELAGSFAKLVPAPAKPRTLAKALAAVLRESGVERERRVSAGRARAAELTWERCAVSTAAVYRAALPRRAR
jgi:alpha-1,3-rhamnosyl/mannosyltransferase